MLLQYGETQEAVGRLSTAIEVSPWELGLREKRANCYEMLGQYQSAISDVK